MTDEQIEKLVNSIKAIDRREALLGMAARYHAQFHKGQDKRVDELWDWKNGIQGSITTLRNLQIILLGAFAAGAGVVGYVVLHHP